MPGDASPDAPRFLDSGVAGMVNTAQESMSPGGSHKPLIDVSRAVSGETTFHFHNTGRCKLFDGNNGYNGYIISEW
jgi:hypothetical protein